MGLRHFLSLDYLNRTSQRARGATKKSTSTPPHVRSPPATFAPMTAPTACSRIQLSAFVTPCTGVYCRRAGIGGKCDDDGRITCPGLKIAGNGRRATAAATEISTGERLDTHRQVTGTAENTGSDQHGPNWSAARLTE